MKNLHITKVETLPLSIPFATPFKISSGSPRPLTEIMLVRLHTSEGVTGIGETQAWRRQGSAETLSSLADMINAHLAPHIIGQSPFSIAAIMHKLEETMYHSLYAQAAISDALFDLQGKLLGVPVWALLGGKCRDGVGACVVLPMKPTPQETVESAARFWEQGFRAFTVKIGLDSRADLTNVRALRERFGHEAVIRVDANAGMHFDSALALLKKLEPYDLDAAEQLLPIWDVDGMAELARRVAIPLMADECVATDHDLLQVIRKRAATVLQTKIAKNGGIWHNRRLWHIGAAAGMRIYPGNHPGTSVSAAAMAHLALAWAGDLLDGPLAVGVMNIEQDVAIEPVRLDGRFVRVPDGPGLGIRLDEEKLTRYRVDL